MSENVENSQNTETDTSATSNATYLKSNIETNDFLSCLPPLCISWSAVIKEFGERYDHCSTLPIELDAVTVCKTNRWKYAALFDCILASVQDHVIPLKTSSSSLTQGFDKENAFCESIFKIAVQAMIIQKEMLKTATSTVPNAIVIRDVYYPWNNSHILHEFFIQDLDINDPRRDVIHQLFHTSLFYEKSLHDVLCLAALNTFKQVIATNNIENVETFIAKRSSSSSSSSSSAILTRKSTTSTTTTNATVVIDSRIISSTNTNNNNDSTKALTTTSSTSVSTNNSNDSSSENNDSIKFLIDTLTEVDRTNDYSSLATNHQSSQHHDYVQSAGNDDNDQQSQHPQRYRDQTQEKIPLNSSHDHVSGKTPIL